MARKKKPEKEENAERWLLTYSDLITLLMVFFVIMYSISTVNAQKMAAVAQALSQVLSGKEMTVLEEPGPSLAPGKSGQKLKQEAAQKSEMEKIKKQVTEYIKNQSTLDKNISKNIVIIEQERGLVISIKDTLLFPEGSATLTPRARNIVCEVGKSLKSISNYIRVEGHTDNLPIHTQQFPSNWELSVVRATNVAHVLNEETGIAPERLSASGYSEYRPLAPNDSELHRQMNRRVDIVILRKKYDYFEP
ncbi:MAG: flagellar motor protein MotB [Chitinophagales bacterium]